MSSRFANSIGPLVGFALALGLFVSICGARTETPVLKQIYLAQSPPLWSYT